MHEERFNLSPDPGGIAHGSTTELDPKDPEFGSQLERFSAQAPGRRSIPGEGVVVGGQLVSEPFDGRHRGFSSRMR